MCVMTFLYFNAKHTEITQHKRRAHTFAWLPHTRAIPLIHMHEWLAVLGYPSRSRMLFICIQESRKCALVLPLSYVCIHECLCHVSTRSIVPMCESVCVRAPEQPVLGPSKWIYTMCIRYVYIVLLFRSVCQQLVLSIVGASGTHASMKKPHP